MDDADLAVWKFASCDGCQLTLLDCEDELLAIAGRVEIAHFLEASTRRSQPGPYDVSLVEGSITTADDAERIQQVREMSRTLVTIGACATAGGVQALRNFADVEEFTLRGVRPPGVHLHAGHVDPDRGARGRRLRAARLPDRPAPAARGHHRPAGRPQAEHPGRTACASSASSAATCAWWSRTARRAWDRSTHAGCGALCPAYHRGCYGCFGPMETPNAAAQVGLLRATGMAEADVAACLPHVQRRRAARSSGCRRARAAGAE